MIGKGLVKKLTAAFVVAASAFVAAASAFTLTLLGVEYHALVWALAGALAALSMAPAQQQQATPRTRVRAVAFVVFSTLAGAAISGGLVVLLGGGKPMLILLALATGYGAQAVLEAALRAVLARLEKLGGAS